MIHKIEAESREQKAGTKKERGEKREGKGGWRVHRLGG
jgi:hypothetical protein